MISFEGIPTTCISDSTKGLYNIDSVICPLKESYKLAGRAFTVKMPVGDNLIVLKAIQEAKPGDVLVIDAKGDRYRAVVGDLFVGLAKTLGIQGMVIDGVIRDIVGVKDLDFPVFCKGTTIAASLKGGFGEINVPISCGGVAIYPGDMIVGDENGVLVVPQAEEEKIWKLAKKQQEQDDEKEKRITGNREESKAFLEKMLKEVNF